jgi:diacylglycerol kinase (ATP)
MKDKIKALFIVNPFSGVGHQHGFETQLAKLLDPDKFDYDIQYTKAPNHATELCSEGVRQGCRLIAAVGGDGTVNEVARPLIGQDITMGIIPSGSGNGLARHLKIPVDTGKAIGLFNQFKTKKIDTVEVNGRFFVSIAGVGFDALVAKKIAGQKNRGFLKYAQIAIWEYFRYKPKKFTMVIDGKRVTRKALFISFANSDQFGYNTSIAPKAKIDDGLIDICIMRKIPLWKTLLMAPLLFRKKIDHSPYLEIIRASEIDLMQKKKHINLDGESIKMSKLLHFKVLPKSLTVVVP